LLHLLLLHLLLLLLRLIAMHFHFVVVVFGCFNFDIL